LYPEAQTNRLVDKIRLRLFVAEEGEFVNTREVVIVEAVRTPIGRGHKEKGYYRDLHPAKLLSTCFTELFTRTGIAPMEVGDVISGCVMQYGEQSYNIARTAWLLADLPFEVPATTVDRQCGSAQQAVNFGSALIASGVVDVAIGAGIEHMGHNPLTNPFEGPGVAWTQELRDMHDVQVQSVGAELIADEWSVTREDMDEIGNLSQQRASRATTEGRFEREIVPIRVNGDTFTTDQGIRPGTSPEGLAALKPAFSADGRITAGNASQISDGASAVMLMSREKAEALGLRPRARIVDQVAVGVSPRTMLTGPIPATKKLLERNKMTIDDIDLHEVNEAFASVIVAWQRELGADLDRVNVNGGAIALGHPVGATGARLITSLLHELERSDKEVGMVTMCCGGGLGTGTIIERV
jgi:acetyl-CoA acetyltransferase family protein